MNSKNSLKYQFKKQLAISIALLIIIFAFMLVQIFSAGIGSSMHRSMLSMAKHYAQQIESNNDFQLPHDDEYSVFVGKGTLPEKVTTMFEIDLLEDYSFSVNDGGGLFKAFHPKIVSFLVVQPLQNSSDKLYLFYNNQREMPPPALFNPRSPLPEGIPSPPRPDRRPLLNVPNSIAFFTLLAILLMYWIIRRLIRTVLTPLNELALMAKNLDENNPEQSFPVMENKTEIGEVAKTLHQSMSRIQQYHHREKQFLQNASHELRTPIAVVSSALDIIKLRTSQGKTNILDQHENIERANKNMAELTGALLLLSRKNSNAAYLEKVNLRELLSTLVKEHQYLLTGKNVGVELIHVDDEEYSLPLALCRIVLSNLIRNAFEHTSAGTVCVHVSKLTVLITNTSTGLTDDFQTTSEQSGNNRQGFGIGLDIVRKIVAQQAWHLNLSSSLQSGSKVVICFAKSSD